MAPVNLEKEHRGFEGDAQEFYRTLIGKKDNVHIIGPSHAIWRDSILAWIAMYMASIGSTGRLTVDEPQEGTEYFNFHTHEKQRQKIGYIGGLGSRTGYEKGLTRLMQIGIPLHRISWNGPMSGLHHIELPDGSVQRVFDHNTSASCVIFMVRHIKDVAEKRREGQRFMLKAMKEEHRILAPGGTLFFQLDSSHFDKDSALPNGIQSVTELLEHAGFEPKHIKIYRVNDVITIPVPVDWISNMQENGLDELTCNKIQFEINLFQRDGNLVITQGWYGPDLFFCTK